MDCTPQGSFVLGISQTRRPEWVVISFSRASSQPRDPTWVSCIGRQIHYNWTTREAQFKIMSKCFSVTKVVSDWLFATRWTATHQASLSLTISRSLPKFMSIESMILSQPFHPLSSPSPFAFSLSQNQGLFQWVDWGYFFCFASSILLLNVLMLGNQTHHSLEPLTTGLLASATEEIELFCNRGEWGEF